MCKHLSDLPQFGRPLYSNLLYDLAASESMNVDSPEQLINVNDSHSLQKNFDGQHVESWVVMQEINNVGNACSDLLILTCVFDDKTDIYM